MGLYKLFSYNVEVQYKSGFLSKAMLFTMITTVLNLALPFFIAYRSRGFWLRTHSFYEQPIVHFTYDYLVVAESDDPSRPIVCGETSELHGTTIKNEEDCVEFQIQEYDYNGDGKNDILDFKINLNIPHQQTITSVVLIFMLDFQLKTVCPLHMQSLAVIHKDFAQPPSGFKYYGDLHFYQTSHLPCKHNLIDTRYNISSFDFKKNSHDSIIDFILQNYFMREVTTDTKAFYARSQNGHTGSMQMHVRLRVPEMEIRYIPSLMQELKWAWPQYLSLVIVFYWIFNQLKKFVFNHRLLMAWEVVPWKKHH
ncbi:transmembrane protein 231 [Anticarsia gemmatalis]|uniref:transmembrane protein 231 n=1 Tax=Anticarsia gemmatalis TaxID=129554 RepID=UPI003F775863